MSVTVTVTGMDRTIDALLGFEKKLRGNVIKRCLNAAAKPIVKAAEAKVPKAKFNGVNQSGSTGALDAAISYHTAEKRGSRGSIYHAVVGVKTKSPRPRPKTISRGPNKGKVQLNLPTRTAHMIEYGFTHKRGKSSHWVAPKPFMRPAWDSHGGMQALEVFYKQMATEVSAL